MQFHHQHVKILNGSTKKKIHRFPSSSSKASDGHPEEQTLSVDKYQDWMDDIIFGRVDHAQQVLEAATSEEKNLLLHGTFLEEADNADDFPLNCCLHSWTKHLQKIEWYRGFLKPLHLAVIFCQHDIIKLFMDHDVDIHCQCEKEGNNIFHALVYMANIYPKKEVELVTTYHYLLEVLDTETIRKLLLTDNQQHARPLELAVSWGAFHLASAMLNTSGVYLVKREIKGMSNVLYYDITDYETMKKSRRQWSPLTILTFFDHTSLCEYSKEFITSELVQSWLTQKMRAAFWFIILWGLFRMFYVTTFILGSATTMLSDVSRKGNVSSCVQSYRFISDEMLTFIATIHVIMSAGILLFDMIDVVLVCKAKQVWLFKTPLRKKEILVHFYVYRVNQVFLTIMSLTIFGGYLTHRYSENLTVPTTLLNLALVASAQCCAWSIFYFIQLVPSLGFYVIAIQTMLNDMVHFMVVFILSLLPYVYSFQKIIIDNDKQECPVGFSSPWESMYSTFIVHVNMVDMTQFGGVDKVSLYILHVVYILVIPILLINFLIALFSDSYAFVSANRKVINTVQALSVISMVENRMPPGVSKIYSWIQKQHFHKQGNKIYINRAVLRENNKAAK